MTTTTQQAKKIAELKEQNTALLYALKLVLDADASLTANARKENMEIAIEHARQTYDKHYTK